MEGAQSVMKEMREADIVPSDEAFSTLMKAFFDGRDPAGARQVAQCQTQVSMRMPVYMSIHMSIRISAHVAANSSAHAAVVCSHA